MYYLTNISPISITRPDLVSRSLANYLILLAIHSIMKHFNSEGLHQLKMLKHSQSIKGNIVHGATLI